MIVDQVYVTVSPVDVRFAQCCVASVRRWHPDIPIALLKDETVRPFSTRELEEAWDVEVFAGGRPLPGLGWAQLEPLLLPGGRRCLVLDSDVVLLGPVIERFAAFDADFVVDSAGGMPVPLSQRPDWLRLDYFDLEALRTLDPAFTPPEFTFNVGVLVGTSGILKRSDFDHVLRWGARPQHLHKGVFGGRNQGILNYVLISKARRGELSIARLPFMHWGRTRLPRRGPDALRTRALTATSPHLVVVHWAGPKHPIFWPLPNARLLRHFEASYYSRIRWGALKRRLRATSALGSFLKHSTKNRMRRIRLGLSAGRYRPVA